MQMNLICSWFRYFHCRSSGPSAVFRRIGTLCRADAREVVALAVNIVLRLDHMLAFSYLMEEVAGRLVAGLQVVAPLITTLLDQGLKAGCTHIVYHHKVVVAVGLDGNAYSHAVANRQLGGRLTVLVKKLAADLETCRGSTSLAHRLKILRIDSSPGRAIGGLFGCQGRRRIRQRLCMAHVAQPS